MTAPWSAETFTEAPYWLRSQLMNVWVRLVRDREVHGERPLAIDAFCCQGGASMGLHQAGFAVVGIDKDPAALKRYPFASILADVIKWLPLFIRILQPAIAVGSPPCQADTAAQVIQGRDHPNLIAPFREIVTASGLPYWIENVGGAVRKGNLRADVRLCGLMFGFKTDRHRYFETNVPVSAPEHPVGPRGFEDHRDMPKTKMGRAFVDGELRQYVGNFHGVGAAREDLGVPWMNRDGVRECIPPAYGRHLGEQFMAHLKRQEAA